MTRFYLAYNLVMGLPDVDGWVPCLLIRQERTVNYAEVFHGSSQGEAGRNKIMAWEAWGAEGLMSRGTQMRWKHS